MTSKQPPPEVRRDAPSRWPRFTLATLFLAFVAVAMLGAGLHYGIRAINAGLAVESVVVVLTLCAPPLLLIAVATLRGLLAWINRPRDDDE